MLVEVAVDCDDRGIFRAMVASRWMVRLSGGPILMSSGNAARSSSVISIRTTSRTRGASTDVKSLGRTDEASCRAWHAEAKVNGPEDAALARVVRADQHQVIPELASSVDEPAIVLPGDLPDLHWRPCPTMVDPKSDWSCSRIAIDVRKMGAGGEHLREGVLDGPFCPRWLSRMHY